MRRIKNIFVIIILLFALSGCTLKYDVIINEDLTTEENLEIDINKGTIKEMTEKYGDSFINETLDKYKKYFEEKDYEFKFDSGETISAFASKKNNDLSINEEIMNQIYKYYDFSCNDNYCLLYAVTDSNAICGDGSGMSGLDLSIQVPFKVIENNADKVDKIKNIYTWNTNLGEDDKNIVLLFEKEGNNIVKRNNVFYFIILGIFAIIAIGLVYTIINFIVRVRTGGRPR